MKSVLQGKFGYRLGAIVLGAVWLGLAGLCARVSEKVIAAADECALRRRRLRHRERPFHGEPS